nr:metal-dependent hydrolase [Halovenus carboxidivorans]
MVGLALGAVLFDRPLAGLIAGLAPDGDFLFPDLFGWPLVHRGVTHAAVALLAVVLLAAALRDRRTAAAVGVGYGSHFLIDITTPMGIPLFYPLVSERLHLDVAVTGHAPWVTVLFWLCGLSALGYWYVRR